MIFDTQEHKDTIMSMIDQANFPGKFLDQALSLKKAVSEAKVADPSLVEIHELQG